MDDVVPGVLQRLRAADIMHMAGLAAASLGQEYCRIGAVQATMRRGAQLLGIVDTSHLGHETVASPTNSAEAEETDSSEVHRYVVDVELQSPTVWLANCSCRPAASSICQHTAALLYQWLAQPLSFVSSSSQNTDRSLPLKQEEDVPVSAPRKLKTALKAVHLPGQTLESGSAAYTSVIRGSTPSVTLEEILTQMGLSEIRSIAREYDIVPNGLNKQQLAEAILAVLNQPEVIRKVASALEKPQRQLLATLTLAGGSMTDDDLRGLFERFSFGTADKLQQILLALQSKGLLFRTSLNSSSQQRIGLSSSLFDVGWSIPAEVRAQLRVPVPITPFSMSEAGDEDSERPLIQHVESYHLLSDLLLVARALDGYRLEPDDEKGERNNMSRLSHVPLTPLRTSSSLAYDGAGGIVPPTGLSSSSLLETLHSVVPRMPAFLRYAVRLLRLADILHKDDGGTPYLRLLPNAARLLLGPTRAEVARDLFELWLTQPSYEELFELQEEHLLLRCRTTSLNHPILRPGELEAENSEARQFLIALVAQAPLNQWIRFSAFARFIYRLHPTFLQKRQRLFPSPHWWLEQEEGRPLQPSQLNDWMRAEGHYLARLLRGPLHWWGITDLALANDGQLLAFRLTPLAGLLLNGIMPTEPLAKQSDEDAPPLLHVLETGEVGIACTPAAWPLIELIEDFAERVGVHGNCLCYRLAPKSLTAALSRGQHPTALLQQLHNIAARQAQTDSSLTRLLTQLERWIASYGQVRLYTGVPLLEVADTLVMRELTAITSVTGQVVQMISPTQLILKKQGMERIVEELKRRGQMPLLHEEDDYATD